MNTKPFWDWFRQNHQRLQQETPDFAAFEETADLLQSLDDSLTFEVGMLGEGKFDFVISCGGIEEGIPAVEALYETAPEIAGWTFTKFKQPRDMENARLIAQEEFEYELGEVKAWYETNGSKMDVALFYEDFDEEEEDKFAHLTFIILDCLVGELTVMQKVADVDFAHIDDADPTALVDLDTLKKVLTGL